MGRLILALLAVTTAVQGFSLFEDRCWEVGGEALFWRPCGQPYDYAVRTTAGQVDDLSLKADYDVGFRIWGGTYTSDCCHLFDVDWTHLRTFDRQRTGGASVQIFPNTAAQLDAIVNAHLKFAYDRVEVRAGRYVAQYCKSTAWVYGGAGYLNMQRDQTAIGVAAAGGSVKSVQCAGYEGGLLEIGLGADIKEPYNIHLIGQMGALVGIGERTLKQSLTNNNGTVTYRHPGETSCIAGLQLRLGVQWRCEMGCRWIMVQVSYQLDQYFDAFRLSQSQPGFGAEPIRATTLANVGFAGPSVSVAVRF